MGLFDILINTLLVTNVSNSGTLGLNQDANFQDLTCEPFTL